MNRTKQIVTKFCVQFIIIYTENNNKVIRNYNKFTIQIYTHTHTEYYYSYVNNCLWMDDM